MAMSVGAFLYSTPHFVLPPPSSQFQKNIEPLCTGESSVNETVADGCIQDGVQGYDFLPFFLFAQFLIGAGSTPILTLAPPFVDDHVPAMKAPAMIASLYAAAALGPVFGYALGALMIQYPADIISSHRVTPKDTTPDDPNWIGAWWAGYIFLGIGTFIGALILLLFPRRLRSNFELVNRSSSFGLLTDSTLSNNAAVNRIAVKDDSSTAARGNEMKIENQNNVADTSPASPTTPSPAEGEICFAGTRLDRRLSMNMSFSPPRSRPSMRYHRRTQSSGGSMLLRAAIAAATASHAEEASFSTDSTNDEDEDEFQDVPEALPQYETRPHQMRLDHALRTAGPMLVATPSSASPGAYPLGAEPDQTMRRRSTPVRHFFSFRKTSFGRTPIYHSSRSSRPQQVPEGGGMTPYLSADSIPSELACSSPAENQSCNPEALASRSNGIPTMPDLEEDSLSEAPSTPVKQQVASGADSAPRQNGAVDKEKCGRSTPSTAAECDPILANGDVLKPDSVQEDPLPPGKPHNPRQRRRARKTIRGRSYGFIQDWTKDIPRCICKLLRNKVYIVTCFCICCEMFIIIGFAGFLPKYLETEYQTSKSQASMIAGGLVVPAGALGILVGGLILNRAHLRRRGAIIFVLCVNAIILGCLITFFFAGCENAKVAGFTSDYPLGPFVKTVADGLTPPECFSACACDPNAWMPVCHLKTGITFPSPCFAGCSSGPFISVQKERIYRNCTCLASFIADFPAPAAPRTAAHLNDEVQAGHCHMSCNTLIPFVCVLTVALFLTGVIQNPLLMVTMRSVGKSERSLALGLQFVIIRLLANLPSPITFGRVIDGACLSWRDECGRRGDCALTDRRYLTIYLTGLALIVKGLSVFIYIGLIYLLRNSSQTNQTVNDLRVVSAQTSNHATSLSTESAREQS